jgi:hypothetical protein
MCSLCCRAVAVNEARFDGEPRSCQGRSTFQGVNGVRCDGAPRSYQGRLTFQGVNEVRCEGALHSHNKSSYDLS